MVASQAQPSYLKEAIGDAAHPFVVTSLLIIAHAHTCIMFSILLFDPLDRPRCLLVHFHFVARRVMS